MDIEDTIKKIIEKAGLSREEIKNRIDQEISALSGLIDEEAALLIVAKKIGIDLKENQQAAQYVPDYPLSELKADLNVSVVGRIGEIGDLRTFNRKDGSVGKYFTFNIEDSQTRIRVVVWTGTEIREDTSFTKNEIIRVVNGNVKVGKTGGLELHVGNKSRIQIHPDDINRALFENKKPDLKVFTPINVINLNQQVLNIKGIIGTVFGPKEYKKKTGELGKRASLLLKEGADSISITFWDQNANLVNNLKMGDIVEIYDVFPKKGFRDATKIDLIASSSTKIEIKSHQAIDITNSISPIKNLLENGGSGNVEGVVQEVENVRNVTLKDGTSKNVMSFIIADETGAIKGTLWGDHIEPSLKINDTILISGIYTRKSPISNQNELNLSRDGKIEKSNKVIKPITTGPLNLSPFKQKLDNLSISSNLSLEHIIDINQDKIYKIKGMIVKDLKRITLYEACANCNRKIESCNCGKKTPPIPKIILNGIVDDESQSIRVTWMGTKAEEFLNDTAVNIKEIQIKGEIDEYLKQKSKILVGKEYVMTGRAKFSQYSNGYELNISTFEEVDPEKESRVLIQQLNEG